jgi:methyltransferase
VSTPAVAIAALTLLAVLLIMAGEAALSSYNERMLRAQGAVEPPDDVYRTMRWAYPASFAAMTIEGAFIGPAPRDALAIGLAVFGLAKALKISAISALGPRWTFRVLVPPKAPLVTTGPYRILRHPNYLAVMGEIIGVALIVCAPVTGVLAAVGFGWLMWKRARIEERALALRPTQDDPGTGGRVARQ